MQEKYAKLLKSKYPEYAFQTLYGLAEAYYFRKDYISSFSILELLIRLFQILNSNYKRDGVILTLDIVSSFVFQKIIKEGVERTKIFLEGLEKMINSEYDEKTKQKVTDNDVLSSNCLLSKIISDFWMIKGIFLNDNDSLNKIFSLNLNKICNIYQIDNNTLQYELQSSGSLENLKTTQEILNKMKNVNEKEEETIFRDLAVVSVLLGFNDSK